jgi:hypothetical protein
VVLVAVLWPAGPAAAAAPSVEASVDGDPLDDTPIAVTEDPSLRIEATADRRIQRVAVWVDGELVRSFSPNDTTVSRTVPLTLGRGDNRVAVVVEAGDRTRLVGTVTKDTSAPRVAYTGPFTSSPDEGPPESVPVDRPSIRLAGDLVDASRITRITIRNRYTYTYAGERNRRQRSHVIRDPGPSFSQELLLGPGTNRVRVQIHDAAGRARIQEFALVLRDSEPPTVQFDRIEHVANGSRVRITGTVSDDVKVESVAVTGGRGNGRQYLVEPTTREPAPDRRSVRFETTVPVTRQTGQVRIVAEDIVGTTVSRELPDEYGRPAVPDVQITNARIDDGTVRVRGGVVGGEIDRVVVETTTPDGERVGLATVHDGSVTRRVDVDRRLGAAASDPTVVRLRAVDATGAEYTASRTVGASPTATPTPAAAASTPGRGTATVAPTPALGVTSGVPGADSPVVAAGVATAALSAFAGAVVLFFR